MVQIALLVIALTCPAYPWDRSWLVHGNPIHRDRIPKPGNRKKREITQNRAVGTRAPPHPVRDFLCFWDEPIRSRAHETHAPHGKNDLTDLRGWSGYYLT